MKRLLLLFLLTATGAHAQSAVDLYHDAARLYVDGQREPAEHAAVQGLALDPGNTRLQTLLARIRQEEPPQGGQSGEPNETDESDSSQDDGQQGRDGAERPDDPAAADQTQAQQPDEDGDTPEKQEPSSEGREDGARPGEGEATPQGDGPVEPGRMSREEAERILKAVGADEERLLQQMQRQQARPRRVTRDW